MPFFQVDDQLHANHKTQALVDMGQVGVAALGLWTLAGSQSQSQVADGLDGVVLPGAWRLLGDKRLFNRLAQLLVDVGLWEFRPDGEDGWLFHDWFDIGYAPKAKVQLNRKRTKEMKNPDIINAVRARDGDHCRYCSRKVDWNDRKSDKGGTYDHVVPGMAKGVTNLVVACYGCNRKKGQRTPEQAGMKLLPPPNGPDAASSGSGRRSGLGPDPDQIDERISGVPLGTRSRSRSGSGSGEGDPPGAGQGDGEGSGQDDGEVGPAGDPPPTDPSPGHTGSPWHNHRGGPPNVDEPKCPTHHLDMPCRKCTAAHFRDGAMQGADR